MAPAQPDAARDTVHVSPDSLQLDVGEDASLTASLVDREGHPFEGMVTWIVRDTTTLRRILTTALTAPILPLASGGTYVVASIPDGVSDSARVIVTPGVPAPPSPSTSRSFYVTPSGSGTACTAAQPCALAVALALAADAQ